MNVSEGNKNKTAGRKTKKNITQSQNQMAILYSFIDGIENKENKKRYLNGKNDSKVIAMVLNINVSVVNNAGTREGRIQIAIK